MIELQLEEKTENLSNADKLRFSPRETGSFDASRRALKSVGRRHLYNLHPTA